MAGRLTDLVPEQTPQKLAGGFVFTEGPVWHPDGHLTFSDIPENVIYRYTPGKGVETYLRPSRHANGLAYDREGRLLACEHSGRQVSRQSLDGEMAPLASRYQGTRLNSPNDVVVHSTGRVFFTDPSWATEDDWKEWGIDPESADLDFYGVYRVDPDGLVVLLTSEFEFPNGLAFSPDESVLYVDDTQRGHVKAFDVGSDYTLGNGRVFFDTELGGAEVVDGMKVDTEGNLYFTGASGIRVVTSDGTYLGLITLPEPPANLAFGGEDNRTLFATTWTSIYSLEVNVPGIGTI